MNILSIGNSFSQNATQYLHQIAKGANLNITVVNLFIGGCSLWTHYKNMLLNEKAYPLYFNGENTCFKVSLEEALLSRNWDYVTLQQVSQEAPNYSTYQPYLTELSNYVRKYACHAKQLIHQTWAYEADSNRLCQELGYHRPQEMLSDIISAYAQAARDIHADFILPSGELVQKLLDSGIGPLHADTFHLNKTGCYATGLLWYHLLSGKSAGESNFVPSDFSNTVTLQQHSIIQNVVDSFEIPAT